MKYFTVAFGYVAASAGVANYYDFSSGGTCGFPSNSTELRVSAPRALYDGGNGCGTCVKLTLGVKVAIARITDLCNACSENQFNAGESVYSQLGEEEDLEEISFDWEKTQCPSSTPKISWHADSQKYWARFTISDFPDNIKELSTYTDKWTVLPRSQWGEFDAPKIGGVVPANFKIKITGRSGQTNQYWVTFPSTINFSAVGGNYYSGPAFPLAAIKSCIPK